MKKKWALSVKGKSHEVVVDRSKPGTDIIRVDGRLAARPLDFDETQRAFVIDGSGYSIRRSGAHDFELTPIGSGPLRQPDVVEANSAAGRSTTAILALTAFGIALLGIVVWVFFSLA